MLWSYLAVMSPVLLMMSLRELELPLTTVGKGMAVVSRLTSIPRHWPLTTNSVSYCPANSMVTSSENWGIRVLLANATSTLQVPPGSRVIVLVGEMVKAPVDWRAGVSGVKAKLKVTGAGLLLMIGIYFFFFGEFLATSVAPRSTILCLGSATSTYRQKNMSTCKYRLDKVRSGSREEITRATNSSGLTFNSVPVPMICTLCLDKPLISNCTVSTYLLASLGQKVKTMS